MLAIPAIIGGAPVNHGLATAAYLGAGVFVLLIGAGAVLFNTDAPLEWLGRTIQRALNATVRRRRPVTGLSRRLLSDRDFIRSTLDRGWRSALLAAVGNTVFDYLALLCALRAVGASPRPSLVVLAYAAAELAAQIPFTPGALASWKRDWSARSPRRYPGLCCGYRHAPLPTRVVLLPIPAGGVAYLLFRRRYG